jgi:hypothetical protein
MGQFRWLAYVTAMFVAKYRSMGEAAWQAGNSESIIRKHHLDLKSTNGNVRIVAHIF